jgi:hypothetical protein
MADLLAAGGERLNAAKIKTEFARRNNRAFGIGWISSVQLYFLACW